MKLEISIIFAAVCLCVVSGAKVSNLKDVQDGKTSKLDRLNFLITWLCFFGLMHGLQIQIKTKYNVI